MMNTNNHWNLELSQPNQIQTLFQTDISSYPKAPYNRYVTPIRMIAAMRMDRLRPDPPPTHGMTQNI